MGPDRARLAIHAGLVSELSKPLDALINNGQMKESTARCATLDDTEVDTFVAFCEFAYTDQYTTHDYVQRESSEGVLKELPVFTFNTNTMGHWALDTTSDTFPSGSPMGPSTLFPSRNPPRKDKRDHPLQSDNSLARKPKVLHPFSGLWSEFTQKPGFTFVKAATESSDPDLLVHAKVYVFATRYMVSSLQLQSLKSLYRDLKNFKLSHDNAKRILDLVEFTYDNTGKEEPGGKSKLRDLVIHYVACESQLLANHERFGHLLDENGEIGSDLVMKMAKQKPVSPFLPAAVPF